MTRATHMSTTGDHGDGDGERSSFSTASLNELARRSCFEETRRLMWLDVDADPRSAAAATAALER